jgi:uncharacterized protein YdaU (DUF1376 family)
MTAGKADAWMPLWVGDYLGATSRLTTEQHGAYLLLLMDYWRNGPPPDEDACLGQIARLDRRQWVRQRPVLERFFQPEGGAWRHLRLETEIADARERSARAREKARFAAEKRWGKVVGDPPPDARADAPGKPRAARKVQPKQAPGLSPSPSPSPAEAEDQPGSSALSGAPQGARDLAARAQLRRAVVGEWGEGFAVSYFDPCAWREPGTLVPRTAYAFDKLKRVKALAGQQLVRPARPVATG